MVQVKIAKLNPNNPTWQATSTSRENIIANKSELDKKYIIKPRFAKYYVKI